MTDDSDTSSPASKSARLPGRGPGEMSYLEFGPQDRAVDVVFVHANGFNALTYRRILGPLAKTHRLLAIDQRGHGATSLDTTTDGRGDWLDLRDDLLAFLAVNGLERVILAGHSMGGTACLLAAASTPACCRGLVLFDPVILPRQHGPVPANSPMVEGARRRRANFPSRADAVASYRGRGAFRTWPDEILNDYVAAGFRAQDNGEVTLTCAPEWEASGYGAHEHDPWAALDDVHCPIDIFRAETASTFQYDGHSLAGRTNMNIETVPGSTHFLPMERPDLVQAALSNAITRRSAQATSPNPA